MDHFVRRAALFILTVILAGMTMFTVASVLDYAVHTDQYRPIWGSDLWGPRFRSRQVFVANVVGELVVEALAWSLPCAYPQFRKRRTLVFSFAIVLLLAMRTIVDLFI